MRKGDTYLAVGSAALAASYEIRTKDSPRTWEKTLDRRLPSSFKISLGAEETTKVGTVKRTKVNAELRTCKHPTDRCKYMYVSDMYIG